VTWDLAANFLIDRDAVGVRFSYVLYFMWTEFLLAFCSIHHWVFLLLQVQSRWGWLNTVKLYMDESEHASLPPYLQNGSQLWFSCQQELFAWPPRAASLFRHTGFGQISFTPDGRHFCQVRLCAAPVFFSKALLPCFDPSAEFSLTSQLQYSIALCIGFFCWLQRLELFVTRLCYHGFGFI